MTRDSQARGGRSGPGGLRSVVNTDLLQLGLAPHENRLHLRIEHAYTETDVVEKTQILGALGSVTGIPEGDAAEAEEPQTKARRASFRVRDVTVLTEKGTDGKSAADYFCQGSQIGCNRVSLLDAAGTDAKGNHFVKNKQDTMTLG